MSATYQLGDSVLRLDVRDCCVLLDRGALILHEVDANGRLVLDLLERGLSVLDAAGTIADAADGVEAEVRADIEAFVERLVETGVLRER